MRSRTGVRLLATAACLGMAAAIVAGLRVVGSPTHQRSVQLDLRRVSDLSLMTMQISTYWSQHKSLPRDLASLDLAKDRTTDPVSGAAYDYVAVGAETYRLCATFELPSEPEGSARIYSASAVALRWDHPAGRHCFERGAKYGNAVAEAVNDSEP